MHKYNTRKFIFVLLFLVLNLIGLSVVPARASTVFLSSASGVQIRNYQGWPENEAVNIQMFHDGSTVAYHWGNSIDHAPGGDVYIADADACTEVWIRPHTRYYRPPDVSWSCRDTANIYMVYNDRLHYINSDGSIGNSLYWSNSGPIKSDLLDYGIDVAVCRGNVKTWQRNSNCIGSGSLVGFIATRYNGLSPRGIVNLRDNRRPEIAAFPAGSIPSGTLLHPGDHMPSLNGYANAIMQTDGNFVIYNQYQTPIWNTGTFNPGAVAVFQSDGNFVLYSSELNGHAIWASGTNRPCCVNWNLVMQEDRNLVIYDNFSHAVWATGSH